MKGLRIRPEKEGLRVSLFDLEAEIMEIVWGLGDAPFAVAAVHKRLEVSRPIAYTTVMTTVARLFEKGLLSREKQGRKYMYTPCMSRAAFAAQMTREVLESLPPAGHEAAMAFLVERVADADASELDRLEALIRARRASQDAP